MSGKIISNINKSFIAFLSHRHEQIKEMYRSSDRSVPIFKVFEEWLEDAGTMDVYFGSHIKTTKKHIQIKNNIIKVVKDFLCDNVWVISAISAESKNNDATNRVLTTLWMDKTIQDMIASGIKTSKQIRDPKQPLKNKTAYMLYCADNIKQIKQENPGVRYIEIVKIMSTNWKSIDEKLSQTYNQKALEDRQRYINEMEIYTGKPFLLKSVLLKEEKAAKKKEKQVIREKEKAEKNKNKKKTAWGCYVQEMLINHIFEEDICDHVKKMKKLGEMWKNVIDKSRWKNMAKEYNSKLVKDEKSKVDESESENESKDEKSKVDESESENESKDEKSKVDESESESESDGERENESKVDESESEDDIESIISDMKEDDKPTKKAFDYFCDDRRPKLVKKYPTMPISSINNKMKAEWDHVKTNSKFNSLVRKYTDME